MVDHIHFPGTISPLFPTGKIKKVERRKDKQQDSGFKQSLDQEKKNTETAEDEDGYMPVEQTDDAEQPAETRDDDGALSPDGARREVKGQDRTFGKKIDVHA